MATEVILPRVDMDMTEGQITGWYVREGERIRQGEPLFDIETSKATMEVEAPATGTLQRITARVGDTVPVGTVIAWILAEGEAWHELPAEPASGAAGAAGTTAAEVAVQAATARPCADAGGARAACDARGDDGPVSGGEGDGRGGMRVARPANMASICTRWRAPAHSVASSKPMSGRPARRRRRPMPCAA